MSSRTHHITIITILVTLLMLVPLLSFAQGSEAPWFQQALWSLVVGFFGRLVGLAGLALDWGVNEYVVGFGTNFLTSGIGGAVDILWVAVRDIFNITFIFGLVFIGLKMILNSDDPGTRRWLVSLIMAALLVNFSLYITKTVVDFSNIMATQIAKGFPKDASTGDLTVSLGFMDTFGIQNILSTGDSAMPKTETDGAGYAYIFGAMILFIVTAFVFAAGAIMLFIRYAALCLYMVLSPLMFLSWVFPQMSSITSKYWHGFLGRSFFAPIYLLLVYFSIYLLNAWAKVMSVNGQKPNYPETFSGMGSATLTNFGSTLPPFMLACIFMIAAVVVANKMGADGASTMIGFGKNLQGRAQRSLQRAAIRTTKSAAANTAGRGARRLSYATGAALDRQISRMQNANKNTVAGKLARKVGNSVVVDDLRREGSTKLKNAKFGMKYTRDEEQNRKDTINAQVGANDVVAEGIDARRNLYLHENRARLVQEGQAAEAKLAGGDVEMGGEHIDMEERLKLQEQVAEMRAAQEVPELSADEMKEMNKTVAAMQSKIGSLTSEQLERMFTQRTDDFTEIVGQLKGGQYESLANSKNFNQEQKDHLATIRTNALKAAVEKNGEVSFKALENLTTKQIENLGDDFVRENAHRFTQKQMDDLMKSDNFTDGQKGDYQGARKKQMIEAFKGAELETFFADRKPAEIAAVPFEAYINNPEAINKLESKHMDELYKKLDPAQRDQLRDAILSGQNSSAKQYITTNFNAARNWNTVGNNTGNNQSQGSQNSGNPIVDQNGNPITR
ncbi:MAG: hypothetical protein H6780_01875 [Candidatus Nomurabacteria bacterium]|nr:MAG: hypothetical protein H6780_01875 [Candidatus Nomurabacteria bacterium]